MSHHKLRQDKRCQNCNGFVRKRYCPKCGQENTETRQSFHYLFTHFIEDLVHYDGSFWKTMRYLLTKPGLLTTEYLSGKRMRYVAPVKLYIFLSFFVFFVGGMIGKMTNSLENKGLVSANINPKTIQENPIVSDSTSVDSTPITDKKTVDKDDDTDDGYFFPVNELTVKEYDSIQNALPEHERDPYVVHSAKAKAIELKEKYSASEINHKIMETFTANFPKFLFAYMPVFAFFMWLFFSKRKWMYFDHGIFTLHFFSMILAVVFIVNSIISPINNLLEVKLINFLLYLLNIALYLWMVLYFYKAIRRVYQISRWRAFFLGSIILFTNSIFFLIGICIYMFTIFFII